MVLLLLQAVPMLKHSGRAWEAQPRHSARCTTALHGSACSAPAASQATTSARANPTSATSRYDGQMHKLSIVSTPVAEVADCCQPY